jgi:hypothetical protein
VQHRRFLPLDAHSLLMPDTVHIAVVCPIDDKSFGALDE